MCEWLKILTCQGSCRGSGRKYLPTDDMPADIMTKALHRPKHEKFTALLGLSRPDHCDNSLLSQ